MGRPLGEVSLGMLLLLSGGAIAETDARPEFEVASIKPAAPDAPGRTIRLSSGGRVNITNMTLTWMVASAWGIETFQIVGGPAWLDSAHYDIRAKPESSAKQDEVSRHCSRTGSSSRFITKPGIFPHMFL
jgi:hypothetical protein